MREIANQICHYEGFHGKPSRCHELAWMPRNQAFAADDGRSVVIATEIKDNPGTSITNVAESLTTAVGRTLRLDPCRMTWVERYVDPDRPWRRGPVERLAVVTFRERADDGALLKTEWTFTDRPAVEALIGAPLACALAETSY